MGLQNSEAGFGWVSILLHWLSAIVIAGLFGLGLWMMSLDYYSAWYTKAPFWHKSIGMLFFLLVIVRCLWRLSNTVPVFEINIRPWERIVARTVQYLLYTLMLALPFSGYLVATAKGHAVDVFGWFSIPALVEFDNSSDWASDIHAGLAWAVIILAAFHMLAALKHHFYDKDKTLVKILIANKGEK